MSEDTPRVICIGEALIELTRGPDGAFTAACAGDSINTAVYLARAGLGVSFATHLHEKFRGASLARSGIRAMEGEKIATLAAARSGGVL
jgi:sugar/nucleoside kinase (ribokinase family)